MIHYDPKLLQTWDQLDTVLGAHHRPWTFLETALHRPDMDTGMDTGIPPVAVECSRGNSAVSIEEVGHLRMH